MKVRNSQNYEWQAQHYHFESSTQPSMTIPEQALSIKQILERYARGLPLEGYREPQFNLTEDGEILPDITRMDLTERQEYAEYAKDQIQQFVSKRNQKPMNTPGGAPGGEQSPAIQETQIQEQKTIE